MAKLAAASNVHELLDTKCRSDPCALQQHTALSSQEPPHITLAAVVNTDEGHHYSLCFEKIQKFAEKLLQPFLQHCQELLSHAHIIKTQ